MRIGRAILHRVLGALVFGPLVVCLLFYAIVSVAGGPAPSPDEEVTALGISTRVIDVGAGPPVVFLHGNPDNATGWHLVIDRLSATHRCVAVDLPGFGRATTLPRTYDFSIESQTRFLDALLAELGLHQEPIVLVAHDIGAVMALGWAMEHRDRVRGLVITNTAVHADYPWHTMAKLWSSPVLGELFMLLMNRPLFHKAFGEDSPTVPAAEVDRIYDGISWTSKSSILQLYRVMTRPAYFQKVEPAFRQVTREVKTIVVWGMQDALIPSTFASRIAEDVVAVEDAGHWVLLDAPGAVADAVRSVSAP